MTRSERIAERIRKEFWDTRHNNPATRTPGAIAALMTTVERIDFDDLLGPGVSAEALAGMPTSRAHFSTAHEQISMARSAQDCGYDVMVSCHVDVAMRYRRLAKWFRALERSVTT